MAEHDELVSVEKDGRILTGVGVEESDLNATMERHPPDTAMAGNGDAPSAPAPSAPKPSRGQKRFDQISWERGEAQRRAEAAEQRAQALEAQLAEARRGPATPPAVAPPAPPSAPPQPPSTLAMPAEFPKFDVWFQQNPTKDFDDYLNDREMHRMIVQGYVRQADLDALIRKGIETDRETRTRYEREGEEIARGRAVYGADFDATVSAPHLMENNWPQYLIEAINSQPQPEHIKYRLGKDQALAEKIRTMNPVFAGVELAKLVPPAAVAPTASTVRTMASPPPAPMQPVAGGGKTTAPSSADLAARASDFDYDRSGYREARAKERGLTRRR